MRQFFVYLYVFLSCCIVFGSLAFSQNLTDLTDEFFNGLSEVIEHNMDNAVKCVQEVDAYYRNNQALVQKIRAGTAEAMKHVQPMMEEYMNEVTSSMLASEFDQASLTELENKMSSYKSQQPTRSAATERYLKAIEAFAMKYPQYAMKIAVKAVELVPGISMPSLQ